MTIEIAKPTIPTTIKTTPTVARLIPLTDVVTANLRIAPIAINTKLEPILIGQPPSSDSWLPQKLSWTPQRYPRLDQSKRRSPRWRAKTHSRLQSPPW